MSSNSIPSQNQSHINVRPPPPPNEPPKKKQKKSPLKESYEDFLMHQLCNI